MQTRRDIFRTAAVFGAAALGGRAFSQEETPDTPADAVYARMLNWRIGPTFYTFHKFTFEEAIQKCAAAGATTFGHSLGLMLSKDIQEKVNPKISKEGFRRMKELIAEYGCTPHAVGVSPANREHFEFAASLGISNLDSEPGFDSLDEVNRLAEEYKINVGLHNHPKPSIYWDPDIILEKLKDCGSRVGACCDTGHWYRSGLDSLECVKKLRGKISSFHIKDLTAQKRDIPLGRGVCKIAEILRELADTKTQTVFSIEYESDWDTNVAQVAECMRFFHRTAKEIVTE